MNHLGFFDIWRHVGSLESWCVLDCLFGVGMYSGAWWCLVVVGCVHTKSQGRLREDRAYSLRLDNSRDLLSILCQDNLERCQFSASQPGWLCIASIETR